MDLRQLANFFQSDVMQGQTRLLSFYQEHGLCERIIPPEVLLKNLRAALLECTYPVLMAQFKLVESALDFQAYTAALHDDTIRGYIFETYPVLQKRIATVLDQWLHQACLLAKRLTHDLPAISALFFPDALTIKIQSIHFGLGDRHRSGQSVALCEFEGNRKLIYKPRCLSIDAHFLGLVSWLNAFPLADLRVPRVLNGEGYGWAEFIEQKPSPHAESVGMFYERTGVLLCLIHALGGSDFHHENIIASDSFPYPIDLESLFQPRIMVSPSALDPTWDDSVLQCAFLPTKVSLGSETAVDIGGLTDVTGQEGLWDQLVLMSDDKGSFNFKRMKGHLVGGTNLPVLEGQRIGLNADYSKRLMKGFQSTYEVILTNRQQFLEKLESFKHDTIRIIFRNTAAYATILRESQHPLLLKSFALWKERLNVLSRPEAHVHFNREIIPHEISALENSDVPLFTAQAAGQHLWVNDQDCLPNFLVESGFALTTQKISRLSTEDMHKQLRIIQDLLLPQTGQALHLPNQIEGIDGTVRSVTSFLSKQIHIDQSSASWMVWRSASLDNQLLEQRPAGYDLHSGMAGEILVLHHAARLTGCEMSFELNRKLRPLFRKAISRLGAQSLPLGFLTGWGGLLYLCGLLGDSETLDIILTKSGFSEAIQQDHEYSLVNGAAGFILACAELYLDGGDLRCLSWAEEAAAQLLKQRHPSSQGLAWKIKSAVPLSGMAHGASGFALAFARLFQATGNPAYRKATLEILAHERTLFLPDQGNWRDCRDIMRERFGDHPHCSLGWSHGAPGIGMARLAILASGIDSPEIREDLGIAYTTTLNQGFSQRPSLIFGDLGNLDFLLLHNQLIHHGISERVQQQSQRLFASLEPSAFLSAGLMSGVTGLAYQCLRLAFPAKVPSVLLGQLKPFAG